MKRVRRPLGFTLVELLVALAAMALLSVSAWRGLGGMVSGVATLQERADDDQALNTTLAQWRTDLDMLNSQTDLPALEWDGNTLRLLRRDSLDAGLRVVAWSLGAPGADSTRYWLRWESPVLRDRAAVKATWSEAALWALNPSAAQRLREVRLIALDGWQLLFFRGATWSNPMSGADAVAGIAPPADAAIPQGVRLSIQPASGPLAQGTLTVDWALTPAGEAL